MTAPKRQEKMADTTDGSSSAAQRAQQTETDTEDRGFFGRLIGALSTQPENDVSEAGPMAANDPVPTAPGMLNLRRMRVEDVMIPKADIWAVPVTSSLDELLGVFRKCALTRLPVYDGTLDTPLGFANLKDFALTYGFKDRAPDYDLKAIVRPLLFVPPSMPLGILLQKMQSDRIHMALVIDEYGGTDGLVTIEDLIEQVVGAIEDEHDIEEAQSWVEEGAGIYNALSKTPVDEFEAAIGHTLTGHEDIDEEEVETLGGLVSMLAGHVPVRGEVVRHPDGTEFEVLDADPRRIKRLRVRLAEAIER